MEYVLIGIMMMIVVTIQLITFVSGEILVVRKNILVESEKVTVTEILTVHLD